MNDAAQNKKQPDRKSSRADRIRAGRLALINWLLRSTDGQGTLDDATSAEEINSAYPDRGVWRGQITRSLADDGYIRLVGWRHSRRPSRRKAPVAIWQLVDRRAATVLRTRLRAAIGAQKEGAAE